MHTHQESHGAYVWVIHIEGHQNAPNLLYVSVPAKSRKKYAQAQKKVLTHRSCLCYPPWLRGGFSVSTVGAVCQDFLVEKIGA